MLHPLTRLSTAASLPALLGAALLGAASACGGPAYVQPPIPRVEDHGPTLPLRPLSLTFDRGSTAITAEGAMTFGGTFVGTFSDAGTFTLADGSVWAVMDAEGAIHVGDQTWTTSESRLVRPDGDALASIDASGQLVTSTGAYDVAGITTPSRRLALFLYLVAATYAEDLPEPGTGEPAP